MEFVSLLGDTIYEFTSNRNRLWITFLDFNCGIVYFSIAINRR